MVIDKHLNKRIKFSYRGQYSNKIFSIEIKENNVQEDTYGIYFKYKNKSGDIKKKSKKIDENNFNKIVENILNLDYSNIFINSGCMGRDGTYLLINLEYGLNYMKQYIWSYDKNIEERGLIELNKIINELLDSFNLSKNDLFNNWII